MGSLTRPPTTPRISPSPSHLVKAPDVAKLQAAWGWQKSTETMRPPPQAHGTHKPHSSAFKAPSPPTWEPPQHPMYPPTPAPRTPQVRVIHAGLMIGEGEEGGARPAPLHQLVQHFGVVHPQAVQVPCGEAEAR